MNWDEYIGPEVRLTLIAIMNFIDVLITHHIVDLTQNGLILRYDLEYLAYCHCLRSKARVQQDFDALGPC